MIAQRKTSEATINPELEFNLTFLIRQIHFRRDISNGSKLVAVHLLMASGRRGFCSISVKQLCWELDMRPTQLHTYINELISVGYLERQFHPGRPNTWSIPSVRRLNTHSVHRRTIFKSINKENVTESENAFCQFSSPDPNPDPPPPKAPPPKKPPIRMDIVKALIDVTGDKRSFGLWCKVSRDVPLDEIRYSVEALRIALNDNSVSSPGRYLVGILKSRCPEVFQKQAVRASQHGTDAHIPTQRRPQSDKLEVKSIDWSLNQTNLEQIKRILRM